MLNKERAEKKMYEHRLEAIVATSQANVFYTSDVYPYGRSITLYPLDIEKEPILITPISGSTPVVLMSPPWFSDVRYYGEFYIMTQFAKEPLSIAEQRLIKAQESWEVSKASDPINLFIEALEERDIKKGRVGIDDTNLLFFNLIREKMKLSFPDVEAVHASHIFKDIRMVKTNEEIRRIQEATRITEKAWETSLQNIWNGITEKEFAEIFQQKIISEGGINSSYLGIYWPPISFGRNTAFTDVASPTDYKLKKGDIIRFDGGCSYLGYPCDMARSAVYGRPTQKLKKYWNAIFKGEQTAINLAQPGAKASKIYNVVVDTVRKNGIRHYKRHHTGHGWGIEGYDPPLIGPEDNTVLEEGMVFCFETPYYEVGWGGILHEDIVVIKEEEPQYLTKHQDELTIV